MLHLLQLLVRYRTVLKRYIQENNPSYMQDEVPTVRQIRLGRGALMRVRKSPKKELVGSWIRRVVFFFARCPCHLMGNANNLWQVR